MDRLQRAVSGDMRDLDTTQVVWLDFAFHCDRTWRALEDLLSAEHARFDQVRCEAIAAVVDSRAAWQESDLLAQHAGSVLGALYTDPTMLLSELVDLKE